MKTQMDSDSWVVLEKNVMCPSKEELDELKNVMPVTRDKWKMCGKTGDLPRLQKLFGSFPYAYSSQKMVPEPNLPSLVDRCLKYAFENYPEYSWNGALVNLYMNGADSVGMHHDDEKELNPEAPILSFSFGATRRFVLKANKNHENPITSVLKLDLEHDDLVVMGGKLQDGFQHGVPKTTKPVSWRMNITVRSFFENRKKMKQAE